MTACTASWTCTPSPCGRCRPTCAAEASSSSRSTSPAVWTPRRTSCSSRATCPRTRSLRWVLGCYTQFGELSRMTQFKDEVSSSTRTTLRPGFSPTPCSWRRTSCSIRRTLSPWGRTRSSMSSSAATSPTRFNHFYGDTFTHARALHPEDGRAHHEPRRSRRTRCPSPTPTAASIMMDKPEDITAQIQARRYRLRDGRAL